MTKKYTLTTSEETVTENPEDIIRLMKLAGLTNAEPVAEEVEAEVYEPTEANDELDLDDYSKKSPESISKQKKSIQPTLGDNPLEYSLDENEIYEAMMKEFDETEEVSEAQSPAQKAAFAKMLAAKNPKKEEEVEESTSTDYDATNAASDEKLIKKAVNRKRNYNDDGIAPPSGHHNNTSNRWAESTEEDIAKNLKEAEDEIDELKEELISEDCGCGHGSDCGCGPECDCGCNAVKESTDELSMQDAMSEEQARMRELAGIQEENKINEDESLYAAWDDMCLNVDEDKGISVVFDMKNMPEKRFHVTTSVSGEAGNPGHDHVFVSIDSGMSDHDGNDHLELEDVKNNMTGAALTAQVDGKVKILKTIGSFNNWDDVLPPEPRDPDLWKYPDENLVDSVSKLSMQDAVNESQERLRNLINW
jgi:hypothetical protein